MAEDELELTKQPRLDTSCPNCRDERIFRMPWATLPEDLEDKLIYTCCGCRYVFEVNVVDYTQDGEPMKCYTFKHIADVEPIEDEVEDDEEAGDG